MPLRLAPLFLLLAACRQEPDFDDRYKAAQQQIDARGVAIDKEIETGAPVTSDAATATAAAPLNARQESGQH
ncbi:MAG: hypothetical protein JSR96_09065 [Proteobacteria bacterium]|nr:hypothetical protein [Pseudomonadota bacterium]